MISQIEPIADGFGRRSSAVIQAKGFKQRNEAQFKLLFNRLVVEDHNEFTSSKPLTLFRIQFGEDSFEHSKAYAELLKIVYNPY